MPRLFGYLAWYRLEKHDKNIFLPCIGWIPLDSAAMIGVFFAGNELYLGSASLNEALRRVGIPTMSITVPK